MIADIERVAATPQHAAFLRAVEAAMEAEATAAGFPAAELARIQQVVRRRAGGARVRFLAAEIGAVAGASAIDVDVPTGSRIPGAGGVKLGVKRVVGWYVNYLGQQVAALGQSVVRLGTAMSSELSRLEVEIMDLRDQLARLEGRDGTVDEL